MNPKDTSERMHQELLDALDEELELELEDSMRNGVPAEEQDLGDDKDTRRRYFRELLRLHHRVHQAPFLRARTAHAFGGGAKEIREVAPHSALVGEPCEPPGARQHAEQRHLGQAYGRGAVVDQHDHLAGVRLDRRILDQRLDALGAPILLEDLQRVPEWTARALELEKEIRTRAERYCFMEHAV